MNRICLVALSLGWLAAPAHAVTTANGVVIFNQADAVAGGVTPGDAAGFPVTLSVSGSYRLSGNLAPPAGTDAIDATVAEVSIDLFGFRLAGGGTANNGIHGLERALTVKNGTIRGFTDAVKAEKEGVTVENMRLSDNRNFGVEDLGGNSRIVDSTLTRNKFGITCIACYIGGSSVIGSTDFGISVPSGGGVIVGNYISKNGLQYSVKNFGSEPVGMGNNTIVASGSGQSVFGLIMFMNPNSCSNSPC